MRFIPTKFHAPLDYIVGAALIAAPWIFQFSDNTAATIVPIVLGIGLIAYSLFTNYELGVWKVAPMAVHNLIDIAAGTVLVASPWIFGFADESANVWVPHVVVGIAAIFLGLTTVQQGYSYRKGGHADHGRRLDRTRTERAVAFPAARSARPSSRYSASTTLAVDREGDVSYRCAPRARRRTLPSPRTGIVLVTATAANDNDLYCSLAWGTRLATLTDDATADKSSPAHRRPRCPSGAALADWARQVVRDPNATTKGTLHGCEVGRDQEIFEATAFVAFRRVLRDQRRARRGPDKELADAAPAEVRAAVDYGRSPSPTPSAKSGWPRIGCGRYGASSRAASSSLSVTSTAAIASSR